MGERTKEHLRELLTSFDTAMLITRKDDLNHARPMAIADIEGANVLWFVTSEPTPKTEEVKRDQSVSATFQSATRYVALSGRGELVRDRQKVEELWKPDWKAWFQSKDNPDIVFIRVTVTDAEFWDNAGTKGIRYAFEVAKGMITGEEPKAAPGQYGRVKDLGSGPPSTKH